MKFVIQNHGHIIETFESPSHKKALAQFRLKYPDDKECVLRDWQKYIVNEHTTTFCESYTSIARMHGVTE